MAFIGFGFVEQGLHPIARVLRLLLAIAIQKTTKFEKNRLNRLVWRCGQITQALYRRLPREWFDLCAFRNLRQYPEIALILQLAPRPGSLQTLGEFHLRDEVFGETHSTLCISLDHHQC